MSVSGSNKFCFRSSSSIVRASLQISQRTTHSSDSAATFLIQPTVSLGIQKTPEETCSSLRDQSLRVNPPDARSMSLASWSSIHRMAKRRSRPGVERSTSNRWSYGECNCEVQRAFRALKQRLSRRYLSPMREYRFWSASEKGCSFAFLRSIPGTRIRFRNLSSTASVLETLPGFAVSRRKLLSTL